MSARSWFLCAALFAVMAAAEAQTSDAPPSGTSPRVASGAAPKVSAPAAEVQWNFEVRERAVGETLTAVVFVAHAPQERVECDFSALESDPSWLLAAPAQVRRVLRDERVVGTSITLDLVSLEAGERALPAPALTLIEGSGGRRKLAAGDALARFASVLAPGEDEPRAPLGFRPLEEELESGWAAWQVAAAAGGGLAVAIGAFALLRRKRGVGATLPPTPLERLEALSSRDVEQRESVRDTYYELTALVRSAFDAREGAARSALTDAEWLAALAPSVEANVRAELEALLRDASEVKYAGRHPTHWAVREMLERARKALEWSARAPERAA
jgi:hypothetical protein